MNENYAPEVIQSVLLKGVRLLAALCTVGVASIQPPAVLAHLHREQRLNNNNFSHPIFYAPCTIGVATVQPPAVLTHLHCEQRLNSNNFSHLIYYALCPVGVAAIQPPAVLTHLHCEQRLNNNNFSHPIFYAPCTVGVATVQPPAVLTHLHCEQRLNNNNFNHPIFYSLYCWCCRHTAVSCAHSPPQHLNCFSFPPENSHIKDRKSRCRYQNNLPDAHRDFFKLPMPEKLRPENPGQKQQIRPENPGLLVPKKGKARKSRQVTTDTAGKFGCQ